MLFGLCPLFLLPFGLCAFFLLPFGFLAGGTNLRARRTPDGCFAGGHLSLQRRSRLLHQLNGAGAGDVRLQAEFAHASVVAQVLPCEPTNRRFGGAARVWCGPSPVPPMRAPTSRGSPSLPWLRWRTVGSASWPPERDTPSSARVTRSNRSPLRSAQDWR
eukprot:COSAG01_NODE_21290_length_909_cov_1.198765_1_plen_159_part_10